MTATTILIVEDEAIVAADLAGKLGQLGYEVVATAAAGEEAVELACRLQPRVVLMDIQLRGPMDGIQAAEAIRRCIDLPVIFLTSHSDSATLERVKKSDPFGYILKPFEERELATTIEMAIFKHRSDRQLRASRVAALNLMEDAVIARREAEETSDKLRLEMAERERADRALRESEERVRLKLESILAPEGDIGTLELADIIDIPAIQALMDDFFRLAHIPMGLLDTNGKVLVGVGWQAACTKFHREHPETLKNCIESDTRLSAGIPEGEYRLYKCLNNLWDAATPVVVGGKHLGNLFTGQFFIEEELPDLEAFRRQADRFGFPTEEYMAAIEVTPRLSRAFIDTAMSYFMKFAAMISRLSYSNIKLARIVTEREALLQSVRESEEQLRRAKDAAEAATKAKSQFLANMSHELRTPMGGVLGMLELTLAGHLDPQQRVYVETAIKSGRSLLRILNDILDQTRIEAGKLFIEEQPFSLAECVSGAVELLSFEARRKGLDLTHVLAEEVPGTVIGDQLRLRQVLVNLIGNAVKFTEQGSVEVRVATGSTTLDGRLEVVFTIRDSGIGIDHDSQHFLFDSFRQADDSHSRIYGGTGLGLTISREIVELMGGTISIESEKGVGSTFTVSISFFEGQAESAHEAAPRETPSPAAETRFTPRLLIAEDDPTIRQILSQIFRMHEIESETVTNGLEAVEMWERGNYDLIIMDVQMPRMDGFEATRTIRDKERERGNRTLILAMTAHASREDEQRCLDAGMDAFISKPIDLAKAIETVRKLVDSSSKPA